MKFHTLNFVNSDGTPVYYKDMQGISSQMQQKPITLGPYVTVQNRWGPNSSFVEYNGPYNNSRPPHVAGDPSVLTPGVQFLSGNPYTLLVGTNFAVCRSLLTKKARLHITIGFFDTKSESENFIKK